MTHGFVKVAAATPELRVADTEFNAKEIISIMQRAGSMGVRLLVLPELCITGYTCGDLFLQKTLQDSAILALKSIVEASAGLDTLVFAGLPVAASDALYNCAAAIYDGQLLALIPKTNIPNYGEFYERRWFSPANGVSSAVQIPGIGEAPLGNYTVFKHRALPEFVVGCEICEDLWVAQPPSALLAQSGATIIVNLSASNEIIGKEDFRRTLIKSQSARLVCAYVYADAGEDESTTDLVFSGHDIIAENGQIIGERGSSFDMVVSEIDVQRLASERRRISFSQELGFCEGIEFGTPVLCETELTREISPTPFVPTGDSERLQRCEKILNLQSLGLRKRVMHSNCKSLVVGVSGGLDSTLALIVAARTADMLELSRSAITAVTMPCFGTTSRTKSNAESLSEKLGVTLRAVDIGEAVKRHFDDIGHSFDDKNVVFENAQARERTQVLMDIANGCGGLVIGTGDLSELALGFATYNGDHMSMYGVNCGVPKTLVRHLVAYFADTCGDAALSAVLRDILDTPVSPELLPAEDGEISQRTEDIVGPYELHDFFLYYLIRWGFSPKKTLRLAKYAFGSVYDEDAIKEWERLFIRRFFSQQFKRSCLPDGPKIGTLSLSPRGDWRMPSDASAQAWLRQLD